MRFKALLLSLAVLPLTAGVAAAQDPSATPISGADARSYGFSPDPYTVNVTAGGSIQASTVGAGCAGTISNSPDFEFTYTAGGGYPLVFRTSSSADTTLVVNGPDGRWYCDDDGAGALNAEVRFVPAQSGVYDVWVGSFSGGMQSAVLSISEIDNGGGAPAPSGGRVDASLAALSGSIRLAAPFSPDPYRVGVTAGGTIQASTVATGCAGMVSSAPDFELTYTAGGYPLIFRSISSADTTLLINGPNGSWHCDDDSGAEGLNAELNFGSPASGVYDVWIGSYGTETASATLEISEIGGGGAAASTAPPVTASATSTLTPDASLTATYGEIVLRSGFTPDPRRIALRAGGPVPAENADAGCAGFIARAPDYQITYTAGRQPLIVRTESASDTTLVVNDPEGLWHCDDDARGDGGDAEVNLDKPSAGVYDIWVGTFDGGTAAATLILTERP